METSLHRQLKSLYATADAQQEVPLDGFRIDVVSDGQLVEIQHGSLAAIRDKIRKLLVRHRVLVVKPLVVRKHLIKLDEAGGRVIERRLSPKQGGVLSLFDELVYFTSVFPHKNLTLETPLVEIEEWRFPGHGRRRRWRHNDHEVADQKLVAVIETLRFHKAADLLRLLPPQLASPFHTGLLATGLSVRRGIAQRIAYCLRQTGAVKEVGKSGNARLYQFATRRKRAG